MNRYVYFIRAGTWMKVGSSRNPASRLETLRRFNGPKLRLECCIRGSFKEEREMHQVFSKSFKRREYDREWFRVGKDFDVKAFLGPDAKYVPIDSFEGMVPFTTKLPPSMVGDLRRIGRDEGLTMSEVFQQAAELWLKANNA